MLADDFTRSQLDRTSLRLYIPQAANAVPMVINRLEAAGMKPISLTLNTPTLDDVFLQVTGLRFEADAQANDNSQVA